MNRTSVWGLMIAVGIFLGLATNGVAQGGSTGSLIGVVQDPSGGVLPGVTVVARARQTGLTQQALTGATGEWRISSLPAGVYDMSFEIEGFKKVARNDVTVEASVTRSLPVTLEVGSLTEVVTVSADAPLLSPNA